MNYARENNFGNCEVARAKKTKTAVPAAQRVYALDAETQRRPRGTERQTQVTACGDATDGFLKVSFLPKVPQGETVQACLLTAELQNDFYDSLERLASHYNIVPMPTRHFEYPCNVALALWDLEEKLKSSVLNFQELRVVQESGKTYLISEEKYSTGTTLYYIPTHPIYRMLKDAKYSKNAHLLFSVCCYLCHIAGIPYHREQGSYLYWLYEMQREWTEQDEDEDGQENQRDVREFDRAEYIGDYLREKIFSAMNLQFFEKRLNSFKPRDAFDKGCIAVAQKAFDLYSHYPEQSIFRNAPIHEMDEDDEPENGSIGMEKYISFISDTTGWLYESLSESINNEFNEYAQMDEPTLIKCFDASELTANSLDFESRFFALLDELCELLYNYKQQENDTIA